VEYFGNVTQEKLTMDLNV
jgi:hypothetical protein